MARVAISYRREDSAGITGRIFDRLNEHYRGYDADGHGIVFMDYDSIPIGIDFRQHIRKALDTCDVLLVIIGPRWVGDDHAGGNRIMQSTDWVRIEVETALKKEIPVVPVLIDRTPMPDAEKLPEALRDLAYRQAVVIDSQIDFNAHVERLTRQLDTILKLTPPVRAKQGPGRDGKSPPGRPATSDEPAINEAETGKRRPRLAIYAAAALALLCTVAGGVWYFVLRDDLGLVPFRSAQLGVIVPIPTVKVFLNLSEETERRLTLTLLSNQKIATITRVPRGDRDIKIDRQLERNAFTNDGYQVTLDKPDDRSQNWYVLSGAKDPSVFYVRRWYTADSIITMDFHYSMQNKSDVSKVIDAMSNTLRCDQMGQPVRC
jgi:TIR domain